MIESLGNQESNEAGTNVQETSFSHHGMHFELLHFKEMLDADTVEENFILSELPDEKAELVRSWYEAIITEKENFIGEGNHAVIVRNEDMPGTCLKCQWESLHVETKKRQYNKLPPTAQSLRKIQDYFEQVKEKRRAFQKQGWNFEAQNKPLKEAVLTRAARLALGKHGIREGIPQVADIIRIEHEEDGLCELGDPFTVNETMYIITMQEIQALNVERIILEYGENTYDMKKVTANLAEILGTLHKEGIYHKDLSLRNVLIDPVTSEVWVIDFGAAEHRNTKDETLAASDMDQCSKMLRWLERYKADPEGTRVDLEAKYGKD